MACFNSVGNNPRRICSGHMPSLHFFNSCLHLINFFLVLFRLCGGGELAILYLNSKVMRSNKDPGIRQGVGMVGVGGG